MTVGVGETPAKESFDPGPKTPDAQAKMSPGPESKDSEEPKKGPVKKRVTIEGSRRLVCKRCHHFLVEVKSDDFEVATVCARCKTENYFSFARQELK